MKKNILLLTILFISMLLIANSPDFHRSYVTGNGITYKSVIAETKWTGVYHKTSAFLKDALTGQTYKNTSKIGMNYTKTNKISQVWNLFGIRATSYWKSLSR
jgi:hypothetical protein